MSAEEGSGLRALEVAVRALQSGRVRLAVVGAVDLPGDPRTALPTQCERPFSAQATPRPFDRRADGPVIGEGAAALVLKTLADARRDGDRVVALVRGLGGASGGAAHDLLPTPRAYAEALRKACREADVEPRRIGYLDAHASAVPAEDRLESTALRAVFGRDLPVLGSAKADVGHAGAAAALAGVVKAALALHHGARTSVRPPPAAGLRRRQALRGLRRTDALMSPSPALGTAGQGAGVT